jgi:hypothetical protein
LEQSCRKEKKEHMQMQRALISLSVFGVLAIAAAAPAQASLVLSISPSHAYMGKSGVFDVLLTNTASGATTFNVGDFSYELTTDPSQTTNGVSDLTFTGANADAVGADGTPYVFPGNGVAFAPFPYSIEAPTASTPTDISAGDSDFAAPGYMTVAPGQTYSLGDVSYSVANGVTYGTNLNVSFANVYDASTNPNGTTSITDENANPYAITVVNGMVSATPEPSQIGMLALMGLGLGGLLLHKRRQKDN